MTSLVNILVEFS